MRNRITLLLLVFLGLVTVASAQVYPVSVKGSLTLPVSNRLTDMASTDAQKIMFVVSLNDPVQASLDVYFRVAVKNNNKLIMQSRADEKSVRKTLIKGQPLTLTGSDLAKLFSINNLTGANGSGVSNTLPKGVNAICVQAISVRRDIPVSNEGCASAFFQYLKVPVIELPKCGSQFVAKGSQNIQFKWAPRHIGSSNAPRTVSYEIEIKEIPSAPVSVADVFSSATLFLKRTVTTPSFLLSDTDPKLVAGKTYAWRVKVKPTNGGAYFQNDGNSTFCTFRLLKKGEIATPGCSSGIFETPTVGGVGKPSATIKTGQTVKVGFFDLKINEATPAGSAYDGKGLVYVPFLKANLNVSFSGLKVKDNLRAHTISEMKAVSDVDLSLANVNANTPTQDVGKAIVASVKQLIQSDPSKRMTLNRSVNDRTPIGGPIILGGKDGDGKSLPSLVVTNIRFTPRKAIVDIAMSPPSKESKTKANFYKRDVPILPSGIPGNPQLDLVSDMLIPVGKAGEIVINLNTTESNATKARCDCNGFNTFVIQGKYKMPKEFVNLHDKSKPLYASFSAQSRHWGNLILELTGLKKFGLKPMEDFVFGADKIILDYSTKRSIKNMKTPKGYKKVESDWLGIYIPKVGVTIPKGLTGSKEIVFEGKNILVDNEGIYAKLRGNDLLSINQGKIGSWGFGIDNINIDIEKSGVSNSFIAGGLQLPIMKGKEAMPYKAIFKKNDESKKYDLTFQAVPKDVAVSLLGSTISFDESSKINIERKDGAFSSPTVDLSGVIKFDLKPTGYVGAAADNYAKLQKLATDNNLGDLVPVFKSEGFKFKNLIIDFSRKGSKFTIGDINPTKSSLAFLGTKANLDDVKFGEIDRDKLDDKIKNKLGKDEKALGFSFETKVAEDVLGGLAPTVTLGFNIKEKFASDGSVDYDFLHYDLEFGAPKIDMSCNNNLKPIAITNTTNYNGSLADLKEIQIGRFVLQPDMSSLAKNADGSYKGTGMIKVPVLGPMQRLSVDFKNLKVNTSKQMYDGVIVTKSDKEGLFKDPNIKGLLGQATSKLNSSANKAVSLPVILGDPKKDGYMFTFTGLEWTAKQASLSARLIVDMGKGKYAEFKAQGLNIVPGGIVGSDVILSLANTVSLKGTSIDYPIEFESYDAEKKTGSYVLCDCDGFKNFNLAGRYVFDKSVIKNLKDKNKPVAASFSVETDEWAAFMGKVESIDSFAIVGLDGFTFKPGTARLDFSESKSLDSVQYPSGYEVEKKWRGLMVESLDIVVPSSITGGKEGSFSAKNLLMDGDGMSGDLSGTQIVDQKSGNLGGWAFSIDSLDMKLRKNALEDGSFKGGIVLPIMSQEKGESMPYVTSFKQKQFKNDKGDDASDYDIDFKAVPTTVEVSLLRSKMTFAETSSITVGRKDGNYEKPKVVLNGTLAMGVEGKESELSPVGKQVWGTIKGSASSLGLKAKDVDNMIPSINTKGLEFKELVIDYSKPGSESKFSIKDIVSNRTRIKFLGSSSYLQEVKFDEYEIDSLQVEDNVKARLKKDSSRVVGLSFKSKLAEDILGGLAPEVTFQLQLEEQPVENEVTYFETNSSGIREQKTKKQEGKKYSFLTYGLDFTKPDVSLSCNSTNKQELSFGEAKEWKVSELDTVSIGYFKVDVKNGKFNGKKFSGEGIADVPVLGPMRHLKVSIKDAEFDDKKQMISGEAVTSGKTFSNTDTGLTGLLADAKQKMTAAANNAVSLPVILGGDVKKDGYTFIFDGLNFGTNKAKLAARVIVDLGNKKYGVFEGQGLDIVPTGIAGVNVKLTLKEELNLKGTAIDLPMSFKPYVEKDSLGSYVQCDCEGFKGFNLQGQLELPEDKIQSVKGLKDASKKVATATFNINAEQWGDFMGEITMTDDVFIPGLAEMPLSFRKAEFDYSDKRNPEKLLESLKDTTGINNEWTGILIPEMELTLPEALTKTTTDKVSKVVGKSIVFDSLGLQGSFMSKNLISAKKASIGGFGFSLDSISIEIEKSSIAENKFVGGLQIPIMKEGEFIPYEGAFKIGQDTATKKQYLDYEFNARPDTVDISLLKSTFVFDTTSTINIKRENGKFSYPVVDLSGTMKINVPSSKNAFGKDFLDKVKQLEEYAGISNIVPDFKLDSIDFKHFKFDPNNEDGKFSIEEIKPKDSKLKFLTLDWSMDEITFDELKDLKEVGEQKAKEAAKVTKSDVAKAIKNLGLQFDFKYGPVGAHFRVKIDEKKVKDEIKYSFNGFEFDLKLPDAPQFTCDTSIVVKDPENTTAGSLETGNTVNVGRYKMQVTEVNGTSGKGTIKIPFLGYTMDVSFSELSVNSDGEMLGGKIITNTEKSLVGVEASATKGKGVPFIASGEQLTKFLSETKKRLTLPISISKQLKELAKLKLPDGLDIIIVGMSFNNKQAAMNIVVSVPSPVQGQAPYQFGIRGLDVRPDGFDLGELKLFLAKDIKF